MMSNKKLIRGFFSYSRQNDKHDGGNLSSFRKSLEFELWDQTAEKVEIFQDQEDIAWGQKWKDKVTLALDESRFFIAVITPSYLKSEGCRFEFEYFLAREKKLGGERILPLLYIETPELKNDKDQIAIEINKRQWFDWTNLRFTALTSAKVKKRLSVFAKQIYELMEKEMVIDIHKKGISIPNSVISDAPPENFPAGWDSEWQPSFDETVITSRRPSLTNTVEKISVPSLPSVYVPMTGTEDDDQKLRITIHLYSQGNPEVDRRRIKTIYGTFISFHGRDRFAFQISENRKSHIIDFPNDTTRICPELLARLKKVVGNENWIIEPLS